MRAIDFQLRSGLEHLGHHGTAGSQYDVRGTSGLDQPIAPGRHGLRPWLSALAGPLRVQPVALKFIDAASGATSFAPSYVDDETLIGSIWRTLTAPPIKAVVSPILRPANISGRAAGTRSLRNN